tara:strand:- start:91 stop:243 length:153 start_codon:yes stop_codon:yes gene_type:complete
MDNLSAHGDDDVIEIQLKGIENFNDTRDKKERELEGTGQPLKFVYSDEED